MWSRLLENAPSQTRQTCQVVGAAPVFPLRNQLAVYRGGIILERGAWCGTRLPSARVAKRPEEMRDKGEHDRRSALGRREGGEP